MFIKKKVNTIEFEDLVKKTNVSSLKKDTSDSLGAIVINRRKFEDLSLQMKKNLVLRRYFDQLRKKISDSDLDQILQDCNKSAQWIKLKNPCKGETVDLDLNVNKDVESVLIALKEILQKKNNGLSSDHAMSEQIELSFHSLSSRIFKVDMNEIQMRVSPLALTHPDGKVKDALNTKKDLSEKSLNINRSLWRRLSAGEKQEFLFHEFAGLLNIPDQNYQLSSRLMYLIDEKYYLR